MRQGAWRERHWHSLPMVVHPRRGVDDRFAGDHLDYGGLGVAASRARRLGHARRVAGINWSMSILAPFWLVRLSFGGWAAVSEIRRQIYEVRHRQQLGFAVGQPSA